MKTKALLLAGLVSLAGVAATQAQTVYSVNVVGFVNVDVPAGGFVLVGNPLNTSGNTLDAILPSVPNNTTKVFRFDSGTGGYILHTKRSTGWQPDGATTVVAPGEGFFVQNTAASAITLTFTGELLQSSGSTPITRNIPQGFSLLSSFIPSSGLVQTQLGLPAQNGDRVYKFVNGGYELYTRRTSSWSSPGEPTMNVAEGFFYQNNSGSAQTWQRVFSVTE
ncbi:MAG TPA: hypothetical protein VGH19_10040 [Verrucomicrobiae bacterium]